ncbi:hypothetical protein [Saccharopolyspora gregorii]|uniref:Copper-binding protein n=1 Tax=Saccharopolyspora gregorii TaxID=33914 RepID=A0ABP6RL36_9PSEU
MRGNDASRGAAALLGTAALVAGLCGGASAAAAAPAAPPPAPAAAEQPARHVLVTMIDYRLLLPAHLPPGRYTFRAVNRGIAPHALEIKGPGVADERTITVRTGASADLTVTLTRGTYDFWCPVGNHRQVGMQRYVHVG